MSANPKLCQRWKRLACRAAKVQVVQRDPARRLFISYQPNNAAARLLCECDIDVLAPSLRVSRGRLQLDMAQNAIAVENDVIPGSVDFRPQDFDGLEPVSKTFVA
jgi:hypothetical protein